MCKIQKYLLPLFLVFVFLLCLTGCAENEDLPANKWLEVKEATAYTYNSSENRDYSIDAKSKGFTTEKMSNDVEWDTPSLRYRSIILDVKKSCKILGMAFELKTDAIEGFNIWVEVQLYKTVSFPSNWEELTEEAKMLWEKENRIKDKQFDSIYIGKNPDAVSFSFDTDKTNLDNSYQIRIYFSTTNPSETDENQGGVVENTDYLKNFMVDNFIVLTEGAE